MTKYYNSKRTRNVFNPASGESFKLSRSKIEDFVKCPRCFYLDRRLGIAQPSGYPFTLNSAVDKLLKKEFDIHRAKGESHPLMKTYGIDAIPFQHEMMEVWRENFKGLEYYYKPANFIITGALDDIWINSKKELHAVDYKATSKGEEIGIDADWQMAYKRQIEIYQWLLRQLGFKVSDTGYFVYCNGNADKEAFDGRLEFNIQIIPYEGNDGWIEKTILNARKCLMNDLIPAANEDCDYCRYRKAVRDFEK